MLHQKVAVDDARISAGQTAPRSSTSCGMCQRESGHISTEAAAGIADWLGLSVEDVLETATFYHFFSSTPRRRAVTEFI